MIRKEIFADNIKDLVVRSVWLSTYTMVEPIADGWVNVHTPFVFTGGDTLSVSVVDQDGKYQITDFGTMFDRCVTRGITVKRTTSLIKQSAAIRGVDTAFIKRGNKHALTVKAGPELFDAALMNISVAMLNIDSAISLKEFGR